MPRYRDLPPGRLLERPPERGGPDWRPGNYWWPREWRRCQRGAVPDWDKHPSCLYLILPGIAYASGDEADVWLQGLPIECGSAQPPRYCWHWDGDGWSAASSWLPRSRMQRRPYGEGRSPRHERQWIASPLPPARLPLRIELKKRYMCACGFVGGPEDAYHSTEFMRRTGCELACRACIDASLGPLGRGRYLSLRDMARMLERLDRGKPATMAPR